MKKISFINVIKKIFDNLSLNKKIIIGIFLYFHYLVHLLRQQVYQV